MCHNVIPLSIHPYIIFYVVFQLLCYGLFYHRFRNGQRVTTVPLTGVLLVYVIPFRLKLLLVYLA